MMESVWFSNHSPEMQFLRFGNFDSHFNGIDAREAQGKKQGLHNTSTGDGR
jgi:hypothetical protein